MRTTRQLTAPSATVLDLARTVAGEAVEAAGRLLRNGVGDDLRVRTKGLTGDVVTHLDLAAEKLIMARIRAVFPDHRIIAEESGLHEAGDTSWSWLIDPLDGTNNVAIGLHSYVVGVALCRDGVPVLGVVHDPILGHTWSAVHGEGTTGPDGRLVLPPYRPAPHGPVLAWAQGYAVGRHNPTAMALRITLESKARRLLALWAPLLAWVMLARGDIDGFVGYRAEAVDLPAGSLIAREAGIVVHGFDGDPFDERIDRPGDLSFVAGHPRAIPDLLAMVRASAGVSVVGL